MKSTSKGTHFSQFQIPSNSLCPYSYLQALANTVAQKCFQNPGKSQVLISTISKRTVKIQVTPESVWTSLAPYGHAASCRMRHIDGMLILEIRRDLFASADPSRELFDSFDPCFPQSGAPGVYTY